MATPTIEAISTQDITIDTDYELEIGITNDPEEVTVGGLFEGFHYSWDADNDILTIAGEATRLLGDAIWTVSAKETAISTAVTREITYNVVPSAPIIEAQNTLKIFKGVLFKRFVKIQNKPVELNVDGLLVGMKHEPATRGFGEDIEFGIDVFGTLPADANLTVGDGSFEVKAGNAEGEDIENAPFIINPEIVAYLQDKDSSELRKISGMGLVEWTQTLTELTPEFCHLPPVVSLDGSIYYATTISGNTDNNRIRKVSPSGTLLWTYTTSSSTFPLTLSPFLLLAADGGVYLQGGSRILKISASGAFEWSYNSGFTINRKVRQTTDDSLYLFTSSMLPNMLHKISSSGVLLWDRTLTTGTSDIVVDEDNAVYGISGRTAWKRNPDGEEVWSYLFPGSGGTFHSPVVGEDGDFLINFGLSTQKISAGGTHQWSAGITSLFSSNLSTSTFLENGDVYLFLSADGILKRVTGRLGEEVWQYDATDNIYQAYFVNSNGEAYLAGSGSTVLKLSESGSEEWTYTLDIGANNSNDFHLSPDGGMYAKRGSNVLFDKLERISPSGELSWSITVPNKKYLFTVV